MPVKLTRGAKVQGNFSVKPLIRTKESLPSSASRRADSDYDVAVQADPLRIFLVEDSPIIRDLILEDLLSIPGVVVVGTAETEKEALEELNALECDLMIVDIQLRQGNGINLLRSLSASARQRNCMKLVLSNHVSGTYRRLCEQYGVRFFFDKTSEFSQLHALVARLRVSAHAH